MPADTREALNVALASLRVPDHKVDINRNAAERLVAEVRSRYHQLDEITPLPGESRDNVVKSQTIFIEMAVTAYLSDVLLSGGAEAVRINDARSADPARAPLIDTNAERTMATQFAEAIRELKTQLETIYAEGWQRREFG